MRVIEKDIWEAHAEGRAIVVPTNGSVNRLGLAVMGRGVALQAAGRFPALRRELGIRLITGGNEVYYFWKYRIFTFPVKRIWSEMARPDLIQRSAQQILALLAKMPSLVPVYIPKVGCGNGGLSWEVVEPVLDACNLGDKAIVVGLPRGENEPR